MGFVRAAGIRFWGDCGHCHPGQGRPTEGRTTPPADQDERNERIRFPRPLRHWFILAISCRIAAALKRMFLLSPIG
jgi:hypothetical protein